MTVFSLTAIRIFPLHFMFRLVYECTMPFSSWSFNLIMVFYSNNRCVKNLIAQVANSPQQALLVTSQLPKTYCR